MNIKNNQNINIAVIGYGDFGMNFVIWNEQNMKYINIIYIVEPDESKHDAIKNKGYLIYKKLYDVPLGYINKIQNYHFKVNNRDNMLNIEYKYCDDINNLTGVKTRIDVVYLRGKSHN